ncbi:MAG: hypothetical protein R2705_24915 [Ilumatobacteraceae bacterium]
MRSLWPAHANVLRRLAVDSTINLEKLADVAGHERSAELRDRIADLVNA